MSGAKTKDIGWMYEGPKSSVSRDDYLLGKRIDKNFELYSDVVRKGKSDNEHFFKKTEKTETVQLPINVVRTEDPLVAMKVKQEQRKHDLLSNPNLKMKAERILRKEFEKIQKKRFKKEMKKQIKKEMKKKKKDDSSNSSNNSSDEEQSPRMKVILEKDLPNMPEPRKRRHSRSSEEERIHGSRAPLETRCPIRKHSRSRSPTERRRPDDRNSRKSPEPHPRRRSPQRSPRRSLERRRDKQSPERRPERRSPKRAEQKPHVKAEQKSPRRESPRRRSRSPIPRERHRGRSPEYHRKASQRRSPQRQERRRSRSPEIRRDKSSNGAEKKSKAEEMERKRREMLDNAKWKEQVREDNAKFARAELEKEAESQGSSKNAVFIKAFKQRSEEGKTVSDRIQQNRRRLQKDRHDDY